MKLLTLVILLCVCAHASGYLVGDLPLPKTFPLPNEELSVAMEKPGIYSYRFFINESSKTVIDLAGVEKMALLAEQIRYDISLRVEVDQDRNISMALDKCEMRSTTYFTTKQKELFVLSAKYFTEMDNVGAIGCAKDEQPLLLLIRGESGTSGTVLFRIVRGAYAMNGMAEDIIVYFYYPLLFSIIILSAGCTLPSLSFWIVEVMIRVYNDYMSSFRYTRLGVVYGEKGTFV